jgi:hypothetical protein
MLSMKLASLPSMFATSFAGSFSEGSGYFRILSSAIGVEQQPSSRPTHQSIKGEKS